MKIINLSHLGIVHKIIGPIDPVGDSGVDEKRYENLLQTIHLLHSLIMDLRDVASHKISHEHSVKKAGEKADKFLQSIPEEYL